MQKQCTIDAEYKGEERYSKLSIAYQTDEDKAQIDEALNEAMKKSSLTPQIYTSSVSGGKSVLVIEYQDDYDREAGEVFEYLIKTLNITCD